MSNNIYFISGHLDLTIEEFNVHYVPSIIKAVESGSCFVIGDARGADAMAQQFLWDTLPESERNRVTVFNMVAKPRNNPGFQFRSGFTTDAERDAAMTDFSTIDIAWVRPGRENSGTAKNLKRRKII